MSDFARLMEAAKYYQDQAPQNGGLKDNNILEVPIVRAEGTVNEAPPEPAPEPAPAPHPAPKADEPPHRERGRS